MMTNLFSTFDPATSIKTSINWISMLSYMLLIPLPYWIMSNRSTMLYKTIMFLMYNEFKILMGINAQGMKLGMISLFFVILMNNMMGLLPYIFTSTSHLVISLTMALPLWMSLMMFGWLNKTNYMFAHLIPAGTPGVLMPFMVIIETTSNLIRPGSLAVRLTANMIAGHLMMSLLGNSLNFNLISIIIITMQLMLMMFELAVALIQAYVFSVLSTLYSSEIM
uniref:ATP synthase F0 subunit 6 n=1 Tax=Pylorgus sordidus TaxID=3089075 RepID=UPI002A83E61F|nr:ATP synthase F0 subunit 6 [Pylorgus sordidus]WOW98224.1 ATP synthase F0 subunit 6 [Pylorgus sordidus]